MKKILKKEKRKGKENKDEEEKENAEKLIKIFLNEWDREEKGNKK